MNDVEKLQFKVGLALNLKSAKDIQNWAINRLDIDPTNSMALEILFFSKEKEILGYFNNIDFEQINIEPTFKKKIYRDALKKYTEAPLSTEYSKELIFNLFVVLLEISKYTEDEDLYYFIMHYQDEFYLALDSISKLKPKEVWPAFLNDLNGWLP